MFGSLPMVVEAQPTHWEDLPFGEHTPWIPRFLQYSENLDLTIYGGYFKNENNDPFLAGFDGENWISLSDTLSGTYNSLVDYESGILIAGGLGFVGTQQMQSIAYFDGSSWSYPWVFDESISKLAWANDTLYAVGWFTEINGEEVYRVARLHNGEWVPVLNPELTLDGSIHDIVYFNGDVYLGGGFEANNGVNRIGRIVNGDLVVVADGLPGLNTAIRDMEVYNGELYMSGIIPAFQGNVGNHIVRYDGESILPVGEMLARDPNVSNLQGTVKKIFVLNDKLIAHGTFRFAGDVAMHNLAQWDGEEWCGLFTGAFHQPEVPNNTSIKVAGTFQDKIMVYVPYFDEEGEQFPLWIYEGGDEVEFCTATFSVEDKNQIPFQLFPNPSSSHITIQSEALLDRIEIIDISGRNVLGESAFPQNGTINISALPAGIYLVQVQTEDGNFGVEKLVVD